MCSIQYVKVNYCPPEIPSRTPLNEDKNQKDWKKKKMAGPNKIKLIKKRSNI